jgi:hypothetical protein
MSLSDEKGLRNTLIVVYRDEDDIREEENYSESARYERQV